MGDANFGQSKGDDVRTGTQGQRLSWPVTVGTGVNGLIKPLIMYNIQYFYNKFKENFMNILRLISH